MVAVHYTPLPYAQQELYQQTSDYLSWMQQAERALSQDAHLEVTQFYLDSYYPTSRIDLSTGEILPGRRSFRRAIDIFWGLDECPYREFKQQKCHGSRCLYCFERDIFSVGSAIIFSQPRYFFTLNKVPHPWLVTQEFMSDLKQYLDDHLTRMTGFPTKISWVWAVERYPRSQEGVHVHGYLHDVHDLHPNLIQTSIDRFCDLGKRKGIPRALNAKVEYVEHSSDSAGTYIMKSRKLSRAVILKAETTMAMEDYRYLNGTRMVHASIGSNSFFRDRWGRPIPRQEACSLARIRYRQTGPLGCPGQDDNPDEDILNEPWLGQRPSGQPSGPPGGSQGPHSGCCVAEVPGSDHSHRHPPITPSACSTAVPLKGRSRCRTI